MSTCSRTTVLVVDDNAFTRLLLVDTLSEAYDVALATEAEAARRMVNELEPNVVIVNLTLPGLESVYLLNGLVATADTPILAITCDCDSNQRAQLLRTGLRDVLTHPVTIDELRAHVDGLALTVRCHSALKTTVRVQREIAAQAAHDLRNLLNTLALTAEALADISSDVPEAKVMRERVHRVADRMCDLIQGIMAAGRCDATSLHCEPLCPEDAIDDVLELNAPMAAAKGVRLQRAVAGTLPRIRADKTHFARVLDNLVANAVKFTGSGGRVAIGATARGNTVIFSVADTGGGIARDDIAHLFDSGWQGAHAKNGHGLGLAIAKNIVDAHGGRLWVKSVIGNGSTFYAALPLSRTASAVQGAA